MLEVSDQQRAGQRQERQRQHRRGPAHGGVSPAQEPGEGERDRHREAAGGDGFGPGVQADPPAPRRVVRHVVGEQRGRGRDRPAWVARRDELRIRRALGGPREQPAVGPPGRQRVQRRGVRALIEDAGPGVLLGLADLDRFAVDDLRGLGRGVVQVADEDCLGGADGDAGRLEAHIQAVRAQVALLRRVVLGVDEDRVIRAGGHACLAADADALVEVDDAVLAPEHGLGRACRHARRVLALVAPGHLERPSDLREYPDVHGLDVGPGHPDRHLVLALARGGARMAPDALALVKHLDPARRRQVGNGHTSP